MVESEAIKQRFKMLSPALDERMSRLVAAAKSLALGYECTFNSLAGYGRDRGSAPRRRPQAATETDPTLKQDLERMVDPRGDPESPLRLDMQANR